MYVYAVFSLVMRGDADPSDCILEFKDFHFSSTRGDLLRPQAVHLNFPMRTLLTVSRRRGI